MPRQFAPQSLYNMMGKFEYFVPEYFVPESDIFVWL